MSTIFFHLFLFSFCFLYMDGGFRLDMGNVLCFTMLSDMREARNNRGGAAASTSRVLME